MCPCAGINNLVILLRARYKCNHDKGTDWTLSVDWSW